MTPEKRRDPNVPRPRPIITLSVTHWAEARNVSRLRTLRLKLRMGMVIVRPRLIVLALMATGCVDAEQSDTLPEGSEQVTPSVSCADITSMSPLEDVRSCADQGYATAQTSLGFIYGNGRGVPQDDAEAVRWYRLAAEQGDAIAQTNLGVMYSTGQGVPEDVVLAYMWYNLAVGQGRDVAQGIKDILEQRMEREQIDEAQRLTLEWIEAHPSGN